MATRIQKLKVGVFLLMCASVGVAGFTIVSGLYKHPGIHYTVEFDESVLGLNEGGTVEYLGVPVGKVSRISVTEDNRALTEVVIDPTKVQLKEGVEATLVIYSLAAGTMAISLSGGDPGAKLLPPESRIPIKPSLMRSVSSRIEETMANVNEIAETIRTGLKGMREGQLRESLEHFDSLLCSTQDLTEQGKGLVSETAETVKDARGQLREVAAQFTKLCENVDRLATNLSGLTGEVRGKVGQLDVARTQEQLNRALLNVSELTQQVKQATEKLGTATDNTLHEADNIQHSLDQALRDTRVALDSVGSLVRQLKEDPSSLVRGKGKVKEKE